VVRSRSRKKLRPQVQGLEPRILLSVEPLSFSHGKAHAAVLPFRLTPHSEPAAIKHTTNKTAREHLAAQTAYLVPGQPGNTINATFTLKERSTPFHDEFGLFLVDDASGRIGKLRPGDRGYTAAALKRRQVVFTRNQNAGAVLELQLPAGSYFGTYLIQNGTSKEFLARNPQNLCRNAPKAFFSFPAANPLHATQVIPVGPNLAGWEDQTHGRPRDFNDEVVQTTFTINSPTQPGGGKTSPPTIQAVLADDTAPFGLTNSDGITSNPSVMGTIHEGQSIATFSASLDSTDPSRFVDVIAYLNPDHTFQFSPAVMARISGAALRDGPHILYLRATNSYDKGTGDFDLPFTLDTTPAAVSFNLDSSTDSAPVGDLQTTFNTVTLDGQTEPNLPVKLLETGATTTADAAGEFRFANVALVAGANLFHVQATDAAGNVGTATNTFTRIVTPPACVFNDLTGWTTDEQGGSTANHGTVAVAGDQVVLREGDSFRVGLERSFVIPAGATSLSFDYANLAFDTSSVGTIKDAFEAALVDASGQSLVHTIGTGRDAFFNITEGQAPALGSEANINGPEVTLNLSGVSSGTTATLIIRLVNNDQDHGTSVAITCVDLPTPVAVSRPANPLSSAPLVVGAATPLISSLAGTIDSGLVGSGHSTAGPALSVESLGGNTSFPAGSNILISGQASAPVALDGKPVQTTDAAGDFFNQVTIQPGRNVLTFTSGSLGGQSSTVTLVLQGSESTSSQLDFGAFSDVSASFRGEYARTSFNEDTKILYANLRVRNTGQYPADAPLIVGVKNISDPTVRAEGFDGTMPDGTPYFDFTKRMAGKTLAPGGTTDYQSLSFLDPNRTQFTYDLVFLGKLNQPPAITSVPVVDAIAGRTYSYAATATDPDGDPLTFSLTTGPSAMQVGPASGHVIWSPTTHDLGTHNITLRVDDGRGGFATQAYVINVTNPPSNRPPYFTSVPVVDANVITAYAYQATAVDPDGNPLTFSVASGPGGLKIDPGTGLVSWTPNAQQLGSNPVTLSVSDGQGGTATQSFTILVQQEPGNHPPVIISKPVTTAVAGTPYTYPVKAIDPDNDPLTYSLTTASTGMSIDPGSGAISWVAPLNHSLTAFSTDFNGSVPSEFSGVTTTEPVQGYAGLGTGSDRFSGAFLRNTTGGIPTGTPGDATVLTLKNLPPHSSIDLEFLLAIIDSWDGGIPNDPFGSDTFNVTIDGASIFSQTYFNSRAGSPSGPSHFKLYRR
jgi:hypothetical protein